MALTSMGGLLTKVTSHGVLAKDGKGGVKLVMMVNDEEGESEIG